MPGPTHQAGTSALGFAFACRFIAFVLLQYAFYLRYWPESVRHAVIDVATVKPAAFIANLLFVDTVANGHRIVGPRAAIEIVSGCEGADMLILLWAAILATSLPWKTRLRGLLFGLLVVYVANELRIVALFGAASVNQSTFELMHSRVLPAVMTLLAAGFFAWTIRSRGYSVEGPLARP